MLCTLCQLPPREDDPLVTLWLDFRGMVTACRQCASLAADGVPAADPAYPAGEAVPQVEGRDLHVCACCRRALRLDDRGTPLRLHEAEVPQGHPHGCLVACVECVSEWAPTIAARLLRERGLRLDPAQLHGDLLL